MSESWNLNEEQVAAGGYDVVAYFERNEAVRGNRAHQVGHDGATFWFSSEQHADMFRETPVNRPGFSREPVM